MGRRKQSAIGITFITLIGGAFLSGSAPPDPLTCNVSGYQESAGLTAVSDASGVTLTWSGQKTDRQIIPATDLPAFGKHKFTIPFDATGKKWVRFAVWDSVGNGAFVQPIKLTTATTTTAAGR